MIMYYYSINEFDSLEFLATGKKEILSTVRFIAADKFENKTYTQEELKQELPKFRDSAFKINPALTLNIVSIYFTDTEEQFLYELICIGQTEIEGDYWDEIRDK